MVEVTTSISDILPQSSETHQLAGRLVSLLLEELEDCVVERAPGQEERMTNSRARFAMSFLFFRDNITSA